MFLLNNWHWPNFAFTVLAFVTSVEYSFVGCFVGFMVWSPLCGLKIYYETKQKASKKSGVPARQSIINRCLHAQCSSALKMKNFLIFFFVEWSLCLTILWITRFLSGRSGCQYLLSRGNHPWRAQYPLRDVNAVFLICKAIASDGCISAENVLLNLHIVFK